MKNLLLFITLLVLLFASTQVMAQNPSIDSLELSRDSVELYDKLEVAIYGNLVYSNPYDYQQVEVWGEFEGPGGNSQRVDGFFMESYEFMGGNGAIQKNGKDGFFLRFSPKEVGQWRFRVGGMDANGQDTSSWHYFDCVGANGGNSKGFVQIGNSNYLKFDDGSPFIPVGHNIAWPNGSAFANYTTWLTSLKSSGGNYFRLWHCHWGLSLEWLGNGYDGLKNYHQSNAFYLDWLHDYCAANEIYTMLCLQHHGQVSTQVNPNWSESPYNQANGGMCANTGEFFTDSAAREATKNRLRYIVARWGYNRSIMAWELFNEVNWTDNFVQNAADISAWHEEMAAFIREIDPNQHILTTSLAEEKERELFWTLPEMEISQNHNYQSTPRIEKVLAEVSKETLETFDKPTLNGEFGISIGGSGLRTQDPDGIHLHNGLWGGFFGGGLGTGGSWWWDSYIHPQNLYYHYQGFKALTEQVSFYDNDYGPVESYTSGNSGDLSLIPNSGWGVLGTDSIFIDKNGQVQGNVNLSEYLYGATWNTQFRSPPTFVVDYAAPGELTIRTAANKGQDPRIVVWLDGSKQLDVIGETNKDYVINIPAGQHAIKVDNSGTDWISLAYYRFSGIGALLEPYVLASAARDELSAWIFNPKYNQDEVSASNVPSPVTGSELVVPDFQNGQYFAKWYDCLTGAWKSTDSVEVVNDTLILPVPSLQWDLGLVVDQQFFVANEKILLETQMNVYPNPLEAGRQFEISGEFGFEQGQARLLDIQGRTVQNWPLEAFDWGSSTYSLTTRSEIPQGYYWLLVSVGNERGAKQLLIK